MSGDTIEEKNVLYGGDIEQEIPISLGELLLLMLRTHQDKVVQVDPTNGRELRADELLSRAVRLATWLREEAGMRPGDTVAVSSENRIEFCLPPIAAFLAAIAVAPINADYTPDEFKHALHLSKPKIVFCSSRVLSKVMSVLGSAPWVERVLVLDSDGANGGRKAYTVDAILKHAPEPISTDDYQCPEVSDTRNVIATVLCSSGTTGLPKGVETTQHNILTVLATLKQATKFDEGEEANAATIGLVPFFHSMGFMTMLLALLIGRKLVIISRFSLRLFLKAVQDYRVTLVAVPPPVVVLMCQCDFLQEYDLSSLREVRSGAAPLPPEYETKLAQKLKISRVSQGYGMTETTLGVLIMPSDEANESRIGSVGRIVPGMWAKVVDEQGCVLGPGQPGELCFRGPLVMRGYVGNDQATFDTIDASGWLHTGDIAYYDQHGYFYIVDRIKELIKYKAYQVPPAELEALLMSHKDVMDCAVVGLPDPQAGELPLAYVVPKPKANITPKQLQDFVKGRVSSPKQLRGGVRFITAIPRNPSGKILRRLLRQMAIKNNSAAKL